MGCIKSLYKILIDFRLQQRSGFDPEPVCLRTVSEQSVTWKACTPVISVFLCHYYSTLIFTSILYSAEGQVGETQNLQTKPLLFRI